MPSLATAWERSSASSCFARCGASGPLHPADCSSPVIARRTSPTRAALWEELRRLNGTPPEVLENAELRRLVEPTLRADFAIDETYLHTNEAPLTCPISAFGGISDREVSGEMLAAWRRHTEGSFELRMMPGDHFFIHASRPILLDALAGDLERLLSRAGGGPPSAGARRHE